ncbi:MAG: hypothetical protein LQ342_002198 [Letrouitia transgressa]|nr:MAG: hypothetical protein LQ342_002198 [Letrouitia transgressa]
MRRGTSQQQHSSVSHNLVYDTTNHRGDETIKLTTFPTTPPCPSFPAFNFTISPPLERLQPKNWISELAVDKRLARYYLPPSSPSKRRSSSTTIKKLERSSVEEDAMPLTPYQSQVPSTNDKIRTPSPPKGTSTPPVEHYPFLAGVFERQSTSEVYHLSSNQNTPDQASNPESPLSELDHLFEGSSTPAQEVSPSLEEETDADKHSEDGSEEDETLIDSVCMAVDKCRAGSGDHRKVVSHIFGRNKQCTHAIPDECWIKYCRKHYQRMKFRSRLEWKWTQLDLIGRQLNKMEDWGGIDHWTIGLRNKERQKLNEENTLIVQRIPFPPGYVRCRERFLEGHLGHHKTFADARALCLAVHHECDSTRADELPGFELLPVLKKEYQPPSKCKSKKGGKATKRSANATKPSERRPKRDSYLDNEDSEHNPELTGISRRINGHKLHSKEEVSEEELYALTPSKRRSNQRQSCENEDTDESTSSYRPRKRRTLSSQEKRLGSLT